MSYHHSDYALQNNRNRQAHVKSQAQSQTQAQSQAQAFDLTFFQLFAFFTSASLFAIFS